MASKGSKILRLLFDADTRDAVKEIVGLEDTLEGAEKAAKQAQDKVSGVGKGVADDTKEADAAMRKLGITSEAAADAQIKQLEAAVETVKKAAAEGKATQGDVVRAQEKLAQKTDRWARLTAANTEDAWLAPLRRIEDRLNRFSGRIRKLGAGAAKIGGAALAGAGVAGGLAFRSIKSAAEADDALFKLSERTGVALELLTGYSLAAEQADLSTEQLSKAFRKMREAIEKDEGAVNALGVATRDAGGAMLDQSEIFENAISVLAGMDDEFEQLSAAAEIFGQRTGPEMAPLLNIGIEGIRQYRDLAGQLGITLDSETGAAAIRFNDNLDTLGRSIIAVRRQASRPLFGAFADVFDTLTGKVIENRDSLVSLAGVVGDKVLSVFRDFVAILEGRDSDVENGWVLQLASLSKTTGSVLVNMVFPALQAILGTLEKMGPTWGKIAVGAVLLGGAIGPIVTAFIAIAAATVKVAAFFGAGALFGKFMGFIRAAVLAVGILVGTVGAIPVAIGAAIVGAGAAIYTWWDEIVAFLKGGIASIKDWFSDALVSPFKAALELAKKVIKYATPVGAIVRGAEAVGVDLPGFATGVIGLQGPGTATSDSILARLSRGESVITARATNYWGHDFMNAINQMVMPPSFGAIPAAMAAAGTPSRGEMITLPIQGPDGVYEGQFDADTADRLTRDMRKRALTKSIRSPAFTRKRY